MTRQVKPCSGTYQTYHLDSCALTAGASRYRAMVVFHEGRLQLRLPAGTQRKTRERPCVSTWVLSVVTAGQNRRRWRKRTGLLRSAQVTRQPRKIWIG